MSQELRVRLEQAAREATSPIYPGSWWRDLWEWIRKTWEAK